MFKITQHHNVLRSLTTILILLVLLPAVFFSAYEFSSLSQNERIVERMYRQQLDAALFSVNQYAWDVADGWARDMNRIMLTPRGTTGRLSTADFTAFLSANKGIQAIFLTDTAGTEVTLRGSGSDKSIEAQMSNSSILGLVRSQQKRLARLSRLAESGYRKIEGIALGEARRDTTAGLLFIGGSTVKNRNVVVVLIDAEEFIRTTLQQKLDETAGGEFILSVVRNSDNNQIYSTDPRLPRGERQTKALWLFPGYTLGIRMHGETIEELVRSRFYRNLTLLGLLDVMILVGAWFLYRTVRRELQLARMQSDFVSNVSHELRTPLSLIRMFGETLEMGRVPTEEKKQEYYSTIVRETERLTGLINNVLSFSRMESGKKAYQLSSVDLNAVVTDVLSSYRSQLDHVGFTVEEDLPAGLPTVMADPAAVAEALLNIIDNAVKYSGDQKWMKIATRFRDKTVNVEVTDHGIGIREEDQAKIFDKFYRATTDMTNGTRGSGLGLTLVRHIMQAHHGEVTVVSQQGAGSTFTLSFPERSERLP